MHVTVLRYARLQPGEKFIVSTTTLVSELCKIALAHGIEALGAQSFGNNRSVPLNKAQYAAASRRLAVLLTIPALLYVAQNNLLWIGVAHLPPATFHATCQLKIVTTAGFSAFVQRRRLGATRWLALGMLLFGVTLVQLGGGDRPLFVQTATEAASPFVGVSAVAAATLFSGAASAIIERVLQRSEGGGWSATEVTRLLAYPSAAAACCLLVARDAATIATRGFFVGWNAATVAIVLLNVASAFLVSAVVARCDGVAKIFATSASLVVSAAVAAWRGEEPLTWRRTVGVFLVAAAVAAYAKPQLLSRERTNKRLSSASALFLAAGERLVELGGSSSRNGSSISKLK